MTIHPQRDGGITVTQTFGHTHNVGSIRDRNGGGTVPELVRVEVGDIVPLSEFLEIPGRALGMHRVCRSVLREDPFTDAGSGLLFPELT